MSCWILGSCTHTFSLNYAGNCGGSPAGTERKTPEAEAHCAARIPCLSKGGLCCKALPRCPGLGAGAPQVGSKYICTKEQRLEKTWQLKREIVMSCRSRSSVKRKIMLLSISRELSSEEAPGPEGGEQLGLFWREKPSGPCLRLFQGTLLGTSLASQLSSYHWV